MAKQLVIITNISTKTNTFEFLAADGELYSEDRGKLESSIEDELRIGHIIWFDNEKDSYIKARKTDSHFYNDFLKVLSLFCRYKNQIDGFHIDQWLPFLCHLNELDSKDLPKELLGKVPVGEGFLPSSFFFFPSIIRVFLHFFFKRHPELRITSFYQLFISRLEEIEIDHNKEEATNKLKELIGDYFQDTGLFVRNCCYFSSLIKQHFFEQYEHRYTQKILDGKIFKLSQKQKDAIVDTSQNCLVKSCAGSGKTAVLIARFFYLVECIKIEDPRKVLLLVYTNQVRDEINDKIKKLWTQDNYSELWPENENGTIPGPAMTIDGCAYSIIRDRYGKNPSILADIENKRYKTIDHNRADILLQKGNFLNDEVFLKSLEEVDKAYYDYLDDLDNRECREYVSYIDQSGPYSLRSCREKWIYEFLYDLYHDTEGNRIEGYAFSYELPDGMTTPDFTIRRENKGGEYHYEHFATRCGRLGDNEYNGAQRDKSNRDRYGDVYYFSTFGDEMNTREALLKDLVKKLESRNLIPPGKEININERVTTFANERIVVKYIKYFRLIRGIIVDNCYERKTVEDKIKELSGFHEFFWNNVYIPLDKLISELYREATEYQFTDFSDSIRWATDILTEWNKERKTDNTIREKHSFDYILVDEYQDLTRSRYYFLKELCKFGRRHLMAVGDDWQSIFSFANSDLSLFLDFTGKNNGWENAKCLDLDESFRFGTSIAQLSSRFVLNQINGGESNLTDRVVMGNEGPFDRVLSLNEVIKLLQYNCESRSFEEHDRVQIGMIDGVVKEIQQENPKAVIAIISRFKEDRHPLFYSWRKKKDPSGDYIKYMTMHQSKGTTVDYSIIVSCNKKSLPYLKDCDELIRILRNNDADKEVQEKENEERRLFYVALTRARKTVYILYDEDQPSDYVKEIQRELLN